MDGGSLLSSSNTENHTPADCSLKTNAVAIANDEATLSTT